MDPEGHSVTVMDLIRITFEDLDLVWLNFMWDVDRATHQDLVDIVFMLYLNK
jgi:hypothetical protein